MSFLDALIPATILITQFCCSFWAQKETLSDHTVLHTQEGGNCIPGSLYLVNYNCSQCVITARHGHFVFPETKNKVEFTCGWYYDGKREILIDSQF